uniref:Uncharacterized protein n=1 Tax=Arundo donax TaxID=35708 RepID=A0A0A9A906_ARUDO
MCSFSFWQLQDFGESKRGKYHSCAFFVFVSSSFLLCCKLILFFVFQVLDISRPQEEARKNKVGEKKISSQGYAADMPS